METDINQFNDDTKKVLLSFPYYEFIYIRGCQFQCFEGKLYFRLYVYSLILLQPVTIYISDNYSLNS